jgi:hypothetical protein
MRRVCGALAVALLASAGCGRVPDPLPGFPRVFLWAWEHPEHMEFVDPYAVGVAFLARTVRWRGTDVTSSPRMQRLEIPPGTKVIAVVRLEAVAAPLPDVDAIAGEVMKAAALPRIGALQIDFDARASERDWYAGLLRRLHGQMPPGVPLTITALASWCLGDSWIRGLPVADAVPMMFSMGIGAVRAVREYSLDVCRSSVGVSTDEVPPAVPHGRRVFLFHPGPWTPEAYRGAMQIARRLQ